MDNWGEGWQQQQQRKSCHIQDDKSFQELTVWISAKTERTILITLYSEQDPAKCVGIPCRSFYQQLFIQMSFNVCTVICVNITDHSREESSTEPTA